MAEIRRVTERAIVVGDLVVVVEWPCCHAHVGKIRRVKKIESRQGQRCADCFASGPAGRYAVVSGDGDAPLCWLKRIPPLDELESSKTDEPMKEPA